LIIHYVRVELYTYVTRFTKTHGTTSSSAGNTLTSCNC